MNSADGPRFFVRFTFTNNDRNMHLNEDGMRMAVAVCADPGDTSTLLPPPPPPPPPRLNHPAWPIAPPPAGEFTCGTGGPGTDAPSTDGYDYCADNTVCPCGPCCYCTCEVPAPCAPAWYDYTSVELTAVQVEPSRGRACHEALIPIRTSTQ